MHYLKVQEDICPKCGNEREIVRYGYCSKRGKETPKGIVGFKCSGCGDYIKIGDIKRGLTKYKKRIILI